VTKRMLLALHYAPAFQRLWLGLSISYLGDSSKEAILSVQSGEGEWGGRLWCAVGLSNRFSSCRKFPLVIH
jgi:hypothetical protein